MEGINIPEYCAIKIKRINTIYLDPVVEVVGQPRTDIHEIPMVPWFFNYPRIPQKDNTTVVTIY